METGLGVEIVGEVGLVRHHAVHKADELLTVGHEPEVAAVMPQTLREFRRGGGLRCREAGGLHGGYCVQVLESCCSDFHISVPFRKIYRSRVSWSPAAEPISSPNSLGRNRGHTFSEVQMTEAASRVPMPQASSMVLP